MIAFDNVDVGSTTETMRSTVEAMAYGAIAFLDALELQRVDLLEFSLGSSVASRSSGLTSYGASCSHPPDRKLRRECTAGPPEVIGAASAAQPTPEGYASVFFAPTGTSRPAGQEATGRIFGRTASRDEPTT